MPRRTANPDEHPQWLYHLHKAIHPEEHPEPNITSGGQARGVYAGMNQDDQMITNLKTIRPEVDGTRKQAAFTNDGLDTNPKAPPIPFSPRREPYVLNLR